MVQPLSARQAQKRKQLLARMQPAPAAPAKKPQVAITDISALAVQEPVSKRAHVLVSIKADAGVTGIGEFPAGQVPATDVQDFLALKTHLAGQDALAAEAVRQRLITHLGKRAPRLVAALNMALLDIIGKLAKAPLFTVLGGPTREKARVLANVQDVPRERRKETLQGLYQAGFRAFVVPVERQGRRGPTFVRHTLEHLEELRKFLGSDVDFVLEGRGLLSPAEAIAIARAIERFHILFFAEPCGQTTAGALRKITEESVVPVGLGQDVTERQAFQDWLKADVIDVLRPDISLLGVTEIRKAAALAETYYVAMAPTHSAGPATTAAGLHIAAALPNFFILEVPVPADERDRHMRRDLVQAPLESPKEGFLPLPTEPGLGLAWDADAVAKYRIKS